jgi:hypothetical protein
MSRERDLLPWILGGLSIAAVALAITAVSSQRAASPVTPAIPIVAAAASPPPAPALTLAAPPAAAVADAVSEPRSADAPLSAATEAAAQPEAQADQIWACTTKGVKTYSNNPCGEKSSLLEVGPINTMNPATPVHYARAYAAQPQYVPPYSDASTQSNAEDDSEQEGYESGGNSYAIVQGGCCPPRRHFEHHSHQPAYHRNSAPAPRKF